MSMYNSCGSAARDHRIAVFKCNNMCENCGIAARCVLSHYCHILIFGTFRKEYSRRVAALPRTIEQHTCINVHKLSQTLQASGNAACVYVFICKRQFCTSGLKTMYTHVLANILCTKTYASISNTVYMKRKKQAARSFHHTSETRHRCGRQRSSKPSLPEHLALAKTFEQKYACSAPI
jgi:hypothetical protein